MPASAQSAHGAVQVEAGIKPGDQTVVRMRGLGPVSYRYAKLESWDKATGQVNLRRSDGHRLNEHDVQWVVSARDAGWLEGSKRDWLCPGTPIILRLLENEEWVSTRVAASGGCDTVDGVYLPLEGVDGLEGVLLEQDVGLLFTPCLSCLAEFAGIRPFRGGSLIDHLKDALIGYGGRVETSLRWVMGARGEDQYPLRCVWLHQSTKEQALRTFAERCESGTDQLRAANGNQAEPELVMLLGPPAAGKSSISRLSRDSVPERLMATAATLPFREEVNNDSLTECLPGFPNEFRRSLEQLSPEAAKAFQVSTLRGERELLNKDEDNSDMSWTLPWLIYWMFHNGPARDSIAWDVIKATVADVDDLSVYYSSVMAAECSTERIEYLMRLAQDTEAPVPHRRMRTVIFWPWASQEQRDLRQRRRSQLELEQGRLLGGNLDSNLVNLHYHAEQAEHNILNLLTPRANGVKVHVDALLLVDNDATAPQVLLSWTDETECRPVTAEESFNFPESVRRAAQDLRVASELVPTGSSLHVAIGKVSRFFLHDQKHSDDVDDIGVTAFEVLDLLMEADEAIFSRVWPSSLATGADLKRTFTTRANDCIHGLGADGARLLKQAISELRKSSVAAAAWQTRAQGAVGHRVIPSC